MSKCSTVRSFMLNASDKTWINENDIVVEELPFTDMTR